MTTGQLQQDGQMSMMAMGGQRAPWQMQPAQMQMGQPLMPPQMYPPPGAMMYISGQGGVVVMVSSLKVGGVAQSDQQT